MIGLIIVIKIQAEGSKIPAQFSAWQNHHNSQLPRPRLPRFPNVDLLETEPDLIQAPLGTCLT